jgi:hypothetical protein
MHNSQGLVLGTADLDPLVDLDPRSKFPSKYGPP